MAVPVALRFKLAEGETTHVVKQRELTQALNAAGASLNPHPFAESVEDAEGAMIEAPEEDPFATPFISFTRFRVVVVVPLPFLLEDELSSAAAATSTLTLSVPAAAEGDGKGLAVAYIGE